LVQRFEWTDKHTHTRAHMYVHAHRSTIVISWSSWYSLSYFVFLGWKLCWKWHHTFCM